MKGEGRKGEGWEARGEEGENGKGGREGRGEENFTLPPYALASASTLPPSRKKLAPPMTDFAVVLFVSLCACRLLIDVVVIIESFFSSDD